LETIPLQFFKDSLGGVRTYDWFLAGPSRSGLMHFIEVELWSNAPNDIASLY
jgi:hypothetical protein